MIWLESQVGTVDWDGAPATQATVIDITERKEAEQALRDSEARFRGFAESAGDWFWDMDENLRFTYVSPNVERIIGVSPEWHYGKTRIDQRGDDYDRAVWDDHLETLRNHQPFRDFTYLRVSDGAKPTWLRTSGLPTFDAEGRFTGYRGTASDVTALKEAEDGRAEMQAQLYQAQKMEALGTLAGGIAHDFNNILTIIMGFAELLELDLEDGSDECHSAKKILDASRRATDLVQQILAFTHQHEQSFEPVRLDRLVAETQELLRATLPSSIDIRADLPKGPVTILGDATQIHQVVMNLCINASHAIGKFPGLIDVALTRDRDGKCNAKGFKGSRESGIGLSVDIETSPDGGRHSMRIGVAEPGDCYRLCIRDTGSGMDRATLERAFDPFFTTKEVGKGTGIGLSVVQGIVAEHGGAIAVETVPGHGTTFTIYLPAAPAAVKSEVPAAEDTPKGGSARILFVDDEAALVDLAVKTLEPYGYRVTGMSDSARALDAFTSDPDGFDLIVTDQTMPKVTGIEIAKAALGARPDIPVILFTGHSENIDQLHARAQGVHNLLHKPVVGRKLVNAVERALLRESGKEGV